MSGSVVSPDQLALLVDGLKAADREVCRAQARRAQALVEFADARKSADQRRIHELEAAGGRPRYRAGEFAAREIGMAVTATRPTVQREVARARRLMTEAPDAWDAWLVGDINEAKAEYIDRAWGRLTRDDSKRILNTIVVAAAVPRTPEALRRWLNRMVVRLEPDRADERIRRAVEDRYVSVRPDLDGVSFLRACLPSLDARAVDYVLEALASVADPDDERTLAQRRADALIDLVLGRISNGWRPTADDADELVRELNEQVAGGPDGVDAEPDGADGDPGAGGAGPDRAAAEPDRAGAAEHAADAAGAIGGTGWIEDAWDLPADAFRPVRTGADDPTDEELSALLERHDGEQPTDGCRDVGFPAPDHRVGPAPERHANPAPAESVSDRRPVVCPRCEHRTPRLTISIGVVVSVQSLLGLTDTPGQLSDGSAHVPAELIRGLAGRPGSLFYRLLTDPKGNLLDVAEVGRFPSRKLAAAVRFRDGVCTNPACHLPADRCDLDHAVPWPEGPTAAGNLGAGCRGDHRAKTHGGFGVTMTGEGTTWSTPTGHRYPALTDPLPVDEWPDTG